LRRFAERLHNDAEMAGIRCAYVSLELSGYTDPNNFGISSDTGHALDAFQTTDRGWFMSMIQDGCLTSNIQAGSKNSEPHCRTTIYNNKFIPEVGWNSSAESMGTLLI